MEKGFDGPMIKRLYKASAMTPFWGEFERGKLTKTEVIDGFISADPEIADEINTAFDSVVGIMGTYDYAHPWIDALKAAGYGVYCITNFTPAGYYQCYDCITFVEKFDGSIFSFKEGLLKPEPAIYQLLLDRYDLKAEECVFIDDTEENVLGARNLGFTGIVFKGYDDAVEKLNNLGINL